MTSRPTGIDTRTVSYGPHKGPRVCYRLSLRGAWWAGASPRRTERTLFPMPEEAIYIGVGRPRESRLKSSIPNRLTPFADAGSLQTA